MVGITYIVLTEILVCKGSPVLSQVLRARMSLRLEVGACSAAAPPAPPAPELPT